MIVGTLIQMFFKKSFSTTHTCAFKNTFEVIMDFQKSYIVHKFPYTP